MLTVTITNNSKTQIMLTFKETKQTIIIPENDSKIVNITRNDLDAAKKAISSAFLSNMILFDICSNCDEQQVNQQETIEQETVINQPKRKKKIVVDEIKEE